MSGFRDSPFCRLKERHDQPNLAERIAGQVVRDLPQPPVLSSTTLARIASRIDERSPTGQRQRRPRWIFAAATFVLGFATLAYAKHLDILPDWLTRSVRSEANLASPQHASPVVSKSRRTRVKPQPISNSQAALKEPPAKNRPSQRPACIQVRPM